MQSAVYWHRGRTPRVEPLRGDASSEAVVVGGGMAGLTCAQALAERGVEVMLLEQAFCGAGASGRSSGFITPDSELQLSDLVARHGEAGGRSLWEFAQSGLDRIERTTRERGLACDRQTQDCLFVASSRRAFRALVEPEHRARRALGYPSDLYDRTALKTVLAARAYHGGVRYPGTFGIDAYAYCRALRDDLQRRGVRIHEGTLVTRVSGRGVETPDARVNARTVAVLTDRALPALGLGVHAVHQVQTFLAVSRPLRDAEIRGVFPGDRLMVWDTDLAYPYFRITGEGRLLLGAARLRDVYARRETHPGAGVRRMLRRYLARQFPGLACEFEYVWPGLIGVTQDFLPVVGRDPVAPEVLFAGAGAGLPWAAALGEYLASKISEGRDELDGVLSANRAFTIGPRLQRLLGARAALALSHAAAKYRRG